MGPNDYHTFPFGHQTAPIEEIAKTIYGENKNDSAIKIDGLDHALRSFTVDDNYKTVFVYGAGLDPTRPYYTPGSDNIKAGSLWATYRYAQAMEGFSQLKLGHVQQLDFSNYVYGDGFDNEGTYSTRINMASNMPSDMVSRSVLAGLVKANSKWQGYVENNYFNSRADEIILMAVAQAIATRMWPNPNTTDSRIAGMNGEGYTMNLLREINGGRPLSRQDYHKSMSALTRWLFSDFDRDSDIYRAANKLIDRHRLDTQVALENLRHEIYTAMSNLPPVDLQLDSGEIVSYRPTTNATIEEDERNESRKAAGIGLGAGVAAGFATVAAAAAVINAKTKDADKAKNDQASSSAMELGLLAGGQDGSAQPSQAVQGASGSQPLGDPPPSVEQLVFGREITAMERFEFKHPKLTKGLKIGVPAFGAASLAAVAGPAKLLFMSRANAGNRTTLATLEGLGAFGLSSTVIGIVAGYYSGQMPKLRSKRDAWLATARPDAHRMADTLQELLKARPPAEHAEFQNYLENNIGKLADDLISFLNPSSPSHVVINAMDRLAGGDLCQIKKQGQRSIGGEATARAKIMLAKLSDDRRLTDGKRSHAAEILYAIEDRQFKNVNGTKRPVDNHAFSFLYLQRMKAKGLTLNQADPVEASKQLLSSILQDVGVPSASAAQWSNEANAAMQGHSPTNYLKEEDIAELNNLQQQALAAGVHAAKVLARRPEVSVEEKQEALAQANVARLALLRKLESFGDRGALTSEQAHQWHARLVVVGARLLETRCAQPTTVKGAEALAHFFHAALWRHCWEFLGGMPGQHLPPIAVERPIFDDGLAAVHSQTGQRFPKPKAGAGAMSIRPSVAVYGDASVRHESGHGEEYNRDGDWRGAPIFDITGHPLDASHQAARLMWVSGSEHRKLLKRELYSVQPEEGFSYLNEAAVQNMMAPYGLRMNRPDGFDDESGLSELLSLIEDAQQAVLTPGANNSFIQTLGKELRKSAVHDDPEAAMLDLTILNNLVLLDEAMRSQAWSQHESDQLKKALESLKVPVQQANGRSKLEQIAKTLGDFVKELQDKHGLLLHAPALPQSDSQVMVPAEVAKPRPIEALALHLKVDSSTLETQLTKAIVDSGFHEKVTELQTQIMADETPKQEALLDAMMKLAKHIIGWGDGFPEKAVPEVRIFDPDLGPGRKTYKRVPGLNAPLPSQAGGDAESWLQRTERAEDSHQKPKSRFRQDLWLLKVPERFLSKKEVEHLPGRLSSLAGFFAYEMAAALSHKRSDGLMSTASVQAANLHGASRARAVGTQLAALGMDDSWAEWRGPAGNADGSANKKSPPVTEATYPSPAEALLASGDLTSYPRQPASSKSRRPEPIQQFLDTHPDSLAHGVWALAAATPQFVSDELTHEGLRAWLKHIAQDANDPRQPQAAAASEAVSTLHYNMPHWLLSRALKAAAETASRQPSP